MAGLTNPLSLQADTAEDEQDKADCWLTGQAASLHKPP